ncbi:hypothetical protein AN901_200313 [Pseudomonas syringae pv. theae]|nr:hypothetical protein AN901_200313 [Pseudomonas syringae pv. theae]
MTDTPTPCWSELAREGITTDPPLSRASSLPQRIAGGLSARLDATFPPPSAHKHLTDTPTPCGSELAREGITTDPPLSRASSLPQGIAGELSARLDATFPPPSVHKHLTGTLTSCGSELAREGITTDPPLSRASSLPQRIAGELSAWLDTTFPSPAAHTHMTDAPTRDCR